MLATSTLSVLALAAFPSQDAPDSHVQRSLAPERPQTRRDASGVPTASRGAGGADTGAVHGPSPSSSVGGASGGGTPSTYRLLGTPNENGNAVPQLIFEIDQVDGAATSLGLTSLLGSIGMTSDARRGRSTVWTSDTRAAFNASFLTTYDVDTNAVNTIGLIAVGSFVRAIAYDERTDTLYCGDTQGVIYELDRETADVTAVANTGIGELWCMDFDASGRLFGISLTTGGLYEIDLASSTSRFVGTPPVNNSIIGLAIRPGDETAYVSHTASDQIWLLDLETADVTAIGPYGAGLDFLVGLAFAPTDATPYVLDFEFEDDFATGLGNGQAVEAGGEFGTLVTVSGAGANLGAAIFDSAPDGPNAGGSDPDLLVGQGNLLILQDASSPSQSVDGVFDDPNDARSGGLLAFAFQQPTTAVSIDLVDICPGPQDAVVVLTDSVGLTRTYVVPNGWTSDVSTLGPPGVGTLDLTTLAPQPGYVSTATAMEDDGFDPSDVLLLEVTLLSSGAVDNLAFLPSE